MYSNGLNVPQNGPKNGPVPQKWPQCQCGNFFISKRGFIVKGFWVFWKCLYTFLYMYTHFVMSSRLVCIPMALLSLKMALPVPQKWPQCQCGNFFISKRGFIVKGFWSVLEVFIHIFIHVHSFCYV